MNIFPRFRELAVSNSGSMSVASALDTRRSINMLDVYGRHFPKHTNYGDITKIEPTSLPNFNLFVGGFPCQSFSIAGKRRGFADTRGTMFFEICRIIGAKRPKYIVLENVKGLLNHEKGRTFSTIIISLQELGYDVEWVLLNSKFHGVPQNRERIFIVADLGERGRSKILPFGKNDKTANGKGSKYLDRVVNSIDAHYHCFPDNHGQRTIIRVNPGEQPQDNRVYSTQGISTTLLSNGVNGLYKIVADRSRNKQGKGRKLESPKDYANALTGVTKDNLIIRVNDRTERGPDGNFRRLQAERVHSPNGISPTLSPTTTNILSKEEVRRLTPIECERLQGFPDDYTSGHSDTQRYKMLGNAVTVNVVKYLFDTLETRLI